jgi:hypothetical protein
MHRKRARSYTPHTMRPWSDISRSQTQADVPQFHKQQINVRLAAR